MAKKPKPSPELTFDDLRRGVLGGWVYYERDTTGDGVTLEPEGMRIQIGVFIPRATIDKARREKAEGSGAWGVSHGSR